MSQLRNFAIIIIVVLFAFFVISIFPKGNNITGYAGFDSDGNNNLTIWYENETGGTGFNLFDNITFYANFTNSTGDPIDNSSGIVYLYALDLSSINNPTMYYNSTSGLWSVKRSYSTMYNGTLWYNITATSSNFSADLIAIDNYTVNSNAGCLNLSTFPQGYSYLLRQSEVLCTDTYTDINLMVSYDPLNDSVSVSNITLDCNGSLLNFTYTGYFNLNYAIGITNQYSATYPENIVVKNCNAGVYRPSVIFVQGNNVTLSNLNLTGRIEGSGTAIIRVEENSSNVVIENSNLSGADTFPGIIFYYSAHNITIRNVIFSEAENSTFGHPGSAVRFKGGSTDIGFHNVSIYNIAWENMNGVPIQAEIGVPVYDFVLADSRFSNFSTIPAAISLSSLLNAIIANNTFADISVTVINPYNAENVSIYNNSFDNCDVPIFVSGDNVSIHDNSANGGIIAVDWGNISIFNNIISGSINSTLLTALFNLSPSERFGGFYVLSDDNSSKTVIIENNEVYNARGSMILGGGRLVLFRNNSFTNITGGSGLNSGLGLINVSNAYFSNNTIENSTYAILLENSTVNMSSFYFLNSIINISSNNTLSTIVGEGDVVFIITPNATNIKDVRIEGSFASLFNDTGLGPIGTGVLNIKNTTITSTDASSKLFGGFAQEGWGFVNFTGNYIGLRDLSLTKGYSPIAYLVLKNNYINNTEVALNGYVHQPVIQGNTFSNSSLDAYIYSSFPAPVSENVFANDAYISRLQTIAGVSNLRLINNTFINITGRNATNFYSGSEGSIVANNTFINVGNTTGYISNFAYGIYNGTNFSSCVLWVSPLARTNSTILQAAHLNINTSLNFSLAMFNDTGANFSSAGCPTQYVTVYTVPALGVDCAYIEGIYPGNCVYESAADVVLSNGYGSNYTWDMSTLSSDGVSFSTAPYLAFLLDNPLAQTSWPIVMDSANFMDFTGNIFKGNRAAPVIMELSGNNTFYNNVFAAGNLTILPNNSVCVNGVGNFYEESLTPVAGDCGPIASMSYSSSLVFDKQDSPIQPVNYDIRRGATYIKTVQSSSPSISTSLGLASGTYIVTVIPWINGSRINGTHFNKSISVTVGGAAAGGGGASVDVPPYIAKGKIPEEVAGIAPGAKVEVVPTEKPAAPKPVVPVVQEKPVQPVVKKPVVPVWLAPLIIAGVVLIILLSVILRHYYGGHKPPAHPPAS